MTSAPINVYSENTANGAAKIRVFLGPADGSASEFTESFNLRPLEVFRIAGSRPDYAVFEFKTDAICEKRDVAKTVTPDRDEISFNRQIYVQAEDANQQDYYDEDAEETVKMSTVIFWGELLTETLQIDPRSQQITIAARVADYHFGNVLEGELQYNPIDSSFYTVPVDPICNPLIDGVVENNAAFYIIEPYNRNYIWVDPEAIRTQPARDAIEASTTVPISAYPEEWFLSDIAQTLAIWLLGDREFIAAAIYSNFIEGESEFDAAEATYQIFRDEPDIKNLQLKRGQHLNQLLDTILIPNGYSWWLDPSPFDPENSKKPVITFFRHGEGKFTEVYLQASGEDLELAETNAQQITVKTDVGNLTTEMRGWGSFEKKELSIVLKRGWPEADDTLTQEDLRRSDPDSAYNTADKKNVWRLWVANEAGDYNGLRTTSPHEITSYLDLSSVFDLYIPHRRVVEDCLTYASNGKRRNPYLEYTIDSGAQFSEAPPDFGWVILPDQLGIYITADVPPEELIDGGNDTFLRLTCTVSGDARLNSTSSPGIDESPSLRTVPLFLDVSDRYHKRSVQTTGPYASELAGDGADEADDADELQAFLADTLENELSAEMQCDFELHGIHLQYQISDVITYVSGRNIYLNRNKAFSEKFVQIIGIRWDFQRQTTGLIVEDVD